MSSRCPERLARAALAVLLLAGCEREERVFDGGPRGMPATSGVQLTELQPGLPTRPPYASLPGTRSIAHGAPFQSNAYAIGEAKHLYNYFNCVGCHAHGGGGIGPALMDSEWIYGSDPEDIYATIVHGRPNGMPAFGGRIPADRVWWLVAYVRSMSGLTPMDARPGRADALHTKEPEVLTGRREPRVETPPPAQGKKR